MSPAHHPDPSTLLAYSAGALATAFAAVVRAHLDACPRCRAAIRAADGIGGHLLELQEGAVLATDARQSLRQRLEAEGRIGPVARSGAVPGPGSANAAAPPPHDEASADALPPSLRRYFGQRYADLRWRMIGPGIHYLRAEGVDDGHLMLLRTAPGRSVPMHTHGGNELTLILKGAYQDVLGHFAPGDVADLDSEVEHQPVTLPGVPCICVAATDAPLRFSGWMARMLQPLFKL